MIHVLYRGLRALLCLLGQRDGNTDSNLPDFEVKKKCGDNLTVNDYPSVVPPDVSPCTLRARWWWVIAGM